MTGDQGLDAALLADFIFENHAGIVPCQQAPDLYFPEKSGTPKAEGYDDLTQAQLAKKNCVQSCPVMMECRMYALRHNETDGIWGGMTANERRLWHKANGGSRNSSRKGIPNKRNYRTRDDV
jgi:hypothetical protein